MGVERDLRGVFNISRPLHYDCFEVGNVKLRVNYLSLLSARLIFM